MQTRILKALGIKKSDEKKLNIEPTKVSSPLLPFSRTVSNMRTQK